MKPWLYLSEQWLQIHWRIGPLVCGSELLREFPDLNKKVLDYLLRLEKAVAFMTDIPVIPKMLQKIKQEKEEVICVDPRWPWISSLVTLSTQPPWKLPVVPNVLMQNVQFHIWTLIVLSNFLEIELAQDFSKVVHM
uniref:Uncharacterized protein n=1 Tax=Sphaerodactylus townsendi TaxID=933632 RepID=A0ACB8GD23_9SAUR